jgi:hypothetical protein
MHVKRFVFASLAVFLLGQVLNYLIHGVFLNPLYQETQHLWRSAADMQAHLWIMWVTGLVSSFLFVYIFIQGYEGRGVQEGLRYGFVIGLFVSLPMAYDTYAVMPIPYRMALEWFLLGTIAWMFMGAMAAIIYRVQPAAPAAPSSAP